MENIGLTAFYQSVSGWPRDESELGTAANRLATLVGTPLAVVYVNEQGTERIASQLPVGLSRIPVEEVLKEEFRKAERPVRLRGLDGYHLMMAPIQAASVEEIAERGPRHPETLGWMLAGGTRAPSPEVETLFTAAVQYLGRLAEIHRLEATIESRSQFLSIASHELKTPLTSIYGLLQLQERMLRLRRSDPATMDPDRLHSFLKMIIRQVERLNELIDGLLDVSRIQNGRFMVEPSDTDVSKLMRDVLDNRLKLIAEEASITVHIEAPSSLTAWVDPVRIEEVITNLVMNAIRFSPEGGAIWVKLQEDDGSFRLQVRDQGPGVPVEDRERIFQPFERAQRTNRMGGMGLGLFISRQIARLHGGNAGLVESVPGRGNIFEARFPIRSVTLASA